MKGLRDCLGCVGMAVGKGFKRLRHAETSCVARGVEVGHVVLRSIDECVIKPKLRRISLRTYQNCCNL